MNVTTKGCLTQYKNTNLKANHNHRYNKMLLLDGV